jgi:hypothetical protein
MARPDKTRRTTPYSHSSFTLNKLRSSRRLPVLRALNLAVLWLVVHIPGAHADTITGTVQDPSGAVVSGARIEITGGDLAACTCVG